MARRQPPSHSPAPTGRPRDSQIDTAVLEATLAALDENGYSGLSIEDVARRAGTTRPAIYRRWPSRARLVLAALARRLDAPEPPDTGCTICDLGEGLNVFLADFRTIRPDVLGALFGDCAGDPELHDEFMTTLFEPPRTAVAHMLDRAIARGDLCADTDRDLVVDMLGSLVYYRALFGHAHLSAAETERAVETLLAGIATDYPALVEHSRQVTSAHAAHSAG